MFFIVGSFFGLEKVQERLENSSLEHEHRDEVVRDGLLRIAEMPITGSGSGSFYSSFPSSKTSLINGFYDHAHNDYIEFAAELGLPMLGLLTIMTIWSLYQALHAMRYRRATIMKGTGFGAAMAIIAMSIQLTTDFHLQSPANAIYFTICLALAWISRFMTLRVGTARQQINDLSLATR